MTDATKLRSALLKEAEEIIENMSKLARGENVPATISLEHMKIVWDAVVPMIQGADDLTKVEGLSSGTITEKVDKVLEHVANGELTIQQGKRLIEMLQAGFNITELPELMQKMAELDGN